MPSVLLETVRPIPNIASLAVMEPSGASGADKKRNKLGYHRTSVACVHCRRRKIRCLVSTDDTQGRCENCIRLRKECQFYPVDQQPPTDRKSRPGMKMETPSSSADPSIASSSPPPAALGGVAGAAGTGSMDPSEMYHYQMSMHSTATTPEMTASGFHPTAGFSVAPMGGFTAAAAATSPEGVPHPDLVSSQTIDPNATWDTTHHNMGNPSPVMWAQGHMLSPQAHAHAHAQPHSSPISPGIPHHHPHHQMQMLSPAAAAAATTYTVRPDGSLWPAPPQRAMTTIPSQPEMYQPGYAPNNLVHPELKRSMTSPAGATIVGPGGGRLTSPLQSPQSPVHHLPQQVQIPVNYAGQPMQFQHHPHPQQQWNPTMNAIPMGDGTYTTIYAPDHYQMTGQHPTTGP